MNIKRFNSKFKECIKTLEEKYNFASVLIQNERVFSATSSTKSESILSLPESEGFVIKAFNGAYFTEYASSIISEDSIDEGVQYLLSQYRKMGEDKIDPLEELEKDFIQECEIDPEGISSKEYLAKAKENREKIEKLSDKIIMTNFRYGYNIKEEIYINRNRDLYQKLFRFDTIYVAILSSGDEVKEIYGGDVKIGGFENSDIDLEKVKEDILIGEKLLGAKRIESSGFYDCILAPSLSGMLAHEAFGHGTEGDMFLKKRARGQHYIGKQVASPLINMWDSADMNSISKANGSFFFDHEGTLAKKVDIIKDGILVSGINDKYSAMKLNAELTSNSRAESFKNKVYTRMTNTCFDAGTSRVEDMIKSIKNGFFIDKATNGMEDPKGWGMQLEALYAEEIKDGQLTGKVYSPVIITGYVPDILKSVTHVSNEFEISTLGYCGKGHKEWVKVTDGGPHLKLKVRLA